MNKISCPACNRGPILVARIFANNALVYVCEECEALWESPEEIAMPVKETYTGYLESRGIDLSLEFKNIRDVIKVLTDEHTSDRICPECEKEVVSETEILPLRETVYYCRRCDSIWKSAEAIRRPVTQTLKSYLESNGIVAIDATKIIRILRPFKI